MSEKEKKKTLKDTAVEIIEDKTGIDVTSKKDIKAVKRFAKEHNPLKSNLPQGKPRGF